MNMTPCEAFERICGYCSGVSLPITENDVRRQAQAWRDSGESVTDEMIQLAITYLQTMEATLATIELDYGEGRGELFRRGGDIWCRRISDGEEWTTETTHSLTTDAEALEVIREAWTDSAWDLTITEVNPHDRP